MRIKIIMGPEFMRVSRYGIESPAVPVTSSIKDVYRQYVHIQATEYIQTKLAKRARAKYIRAMRLENLLSYAKEQNFNWHFDCPPWLISSKPWKDARHGDFCLIDKTTRNLLRKAYS